MNEKGKLMNCCRCLLFVIGVLFCLQINAISIKLTERNIYTALAAEDTEYEVSTVIDLKGNSIQIPKGSNLKFTNRGYLKNGIIHGNSSKIIASEDKVLFDDILIAGTWICPRIYSSWMRFTEDGKRNRQCFQNLCNLSSNEDEGIIIIQKGEYYVSADEKTHIVMSVNSCTKIYIDGIIRLLPNDYASYAIIDIKSKKNVVIEGEGQIIGDVKSHKGVRGEWGMGIRIRSCHHVEIKDISIYDCWGDCVYIGQQSDTDKNGYSSDIIMRRVKCVNGRRQGLSIITGKDILVESCRFFNVGAIKATPPSAGIDIEPNTDFGVLDNIRITSCEFAGNNIGWDLLLTRMNGQSHVYVTDCAFPKGVRLAKLVSGVQFADCFIRAIEDKHDNARKVKWTDCTILAN
ncbi:right-handed parallel beta-helix repeat-containing protein [uncultured Bacteroides sp.]|uniref:right-handed parallel beta-helix repeat-containing protein n=1 Tax=uncultured Bacteroides sp. TaxID=162156 RepID=UPI0026228935|nr:right-handed parallel beta-helix repeat-containing protein [uncultured Bacteroides sp.]